MAETDNTQQPTIVTGGGSAATPTSTPTPSVVPSGGAGDQKPGQGTSATPTRITSEHILKQLEDMPALEMDQLIETLTQLSAGEDEEESAEETSTDEGEEDNADEDVQVDESSISERQAVQIARKVGIEDLTPEARMALATVHNQLMTRAVREAIDSDPDLGYNLKTLTAEGRKSFDELVRRSMEDFVDSTKGRFDYDWDKTAKKAVASAKALIMPLLQRKPAMLGAPGAPGDYDGQDVKEPPRVSEFADEDERNEYLRKKLAFHIQKLSRQTTQVE